MSTSLHPILNIRKHLNLSQNIQKPGMLNISYVSTHLKHPFYKNLGRGDSTACLLDPLWDNLYSLKKRAYQGRSFRDLAMTPKDLRSYRWALRNKGSILTIQSFCSTSVDENVARGFISTASANSIPVLMVFNFSAKCYTTLQLFRLSDTLPSISDFEDERELLVLPKTLFHVMDIKIAEVTGQHTIYLEDVSPKTGLFTLFRCLRKLQDSKDWLVNRIDNIGHTVCVFLFNMTRKRRVNFIG